jgi:glycosyltransferase involved in cell wall biosynthesis
VRVAFLTHNYPRTPGDFSGAFLATLATALVRRGLDVTVVAPSDGGLGGIEMRDGVRIRRVRYASARRETIAYRGTMASALRRPGGALAVRGLWRALRRAAAGELAAGADLVHAHWWVPSGWAVPRGAPFVLTCHGTDVALLGRSAIARAIARPVFARARVVTAVSQELARRIGATVGRTVDGGHVQPMPLDTAGFRAGSGGGGAVVVGRLSAQKRVDLAIAAIAGLRDAGLTVPLTIIGDGVARPALERIVRDRDLGALVRFVGTVPPEAIPSHLASADVMLFPAHGEGFGLAAAEAFMCGVPVVACVDGGGVLDVVPVAGAGRQVAPTPAGLATALRELLADPSARPLALAEGECWRTRLSPDAVATVCERWYHEALGE